MQRFTACFTISFKIRHRLISMLTLVKVCTPKSWQIWTEILSVSKKTIVCAVVRQISGLLKIAESIQFFCKKNWIFNFVKFALFCPILKTTPPRRRWCSSVEIRADLKGQNFPSVSDVWFLSCFTTELANYSWCLQLHNLCVNDISRVCCSCAYMVLIGLDKE